MIQNVDCLQGATVVTNPVDLKGEWTMLECITNLSAVTVADENLLPNSEPEPISVYSKGSCRVGKYTSITCTGVVKLYA